MESKTNTPAQVPGIELKHFLGRGSFGDVWEGLRNNEPVAVKFLQVKIQSQKIGFHFFFLKNLNNTNRK